MTPKGWPPRGQLQGEDSSRSASWRQVALGLIVGRATPRRVANWTEPSEIADHIALSFPIIHAASNWQDSSIRIFQTPCIAVSRGLRDNEPIFDALFCRSDLLLARLSLIVLGSSVNLRLFVVNKSVEQAGEPAGHGSDGLGSAKTRTQAAVLLRSQVALAL